MFKIQNKNLNLFTIAFFVLSFRFWSFGFVPDFGFRASNLAAILSVPLRYFTDKLFIPFLEGS
jgi:hypothetical protein